MKLSPLLVAAIYGEDCEWETHEFQYLTGSTSLYPSDTFSTLAEAQAQCLTVEQADCAGVTYSDWDDLYSLRKNTNPIFFEGDGEMHSWIRPDCADTEATAEPESTWTPDLSIQPVEPTVTTPVCFCCDDDDNENSIEPISDSHKIKPNTLITSGLTVYPEYEMSVDVKLRSTHAGDWTNVLAFQVDSAGADDRLWHGGNGDRIPAVFVAAGTTSVHVCSSVNDNWNYCWNSPNQGTNNWFNIKVKQSLKHFAPSSNNIDNRYIPNNYSYKKLYSNADTFKFFDIDATGFNNDIHLGFSATEGHDDKKWEIVIGGWAGLQSVIRSGNQTPYSGHVKINHTREEYEDLIKNFRVIVNDGSITIKNTATNTVFMKYKSDDIVKSDLKFMLAAGGWGGNGYLNVKPKGGEAPISGSHYFYEVYLNGNLEHSAINETPQTFKKVKAEVANGLSHNGRTFLAAKGVTRNLSFQSSKPKDKPVSQRLDKLLDKIDEIFAPHMASEKSANIRGKWAGLSNKLQDKHEKLTQHCDFPATWKPDEIDTVDRLDPNADPCKNINQMKTQFNKWASIFTSDCRKLDDGSANDWNDKVMLKFDDLVARSHKKLKKVCANVGGTVYACEKTNPDDDRVVSIDCGENVIKIESATYGRPNSNVCLGPGSHTCANTVDHTKDVKQACGNKNSCTYDGGAVANQHGDPCFGVEKHTEIIYKCV